MKVCVVPTSWVLMVWPFYGVEAGEFSRAGSAPILLARFARSGRWDGEDGNPNYFHDGHAVCLMQHRVARLGTAISPQTSESDLVLDSWVPPSNLSPKLTKLWV